MKSTFKSFSIILFCFSLVTGQADFLSDFIADTLFIHMPVGSMLSATNTALQIVDNRNLPDNILGIQQIKKLKYIPVDKYIAINKPLSDVLQGYMMRDSISFDGI